MLRVAGATCQQFSSRVVRRCFSRGSFTRAPGYRGLLGPGFPEAAPRPCRQANDDRRQLDNLRLLQSLLALLPPQIGHPVGFLQVKECLEL